jgi:transposase
VFSIGVNTKFIGGYVVSGDHSRGELSFFQEVVLQTQNICPCFDALFGDGMYANRVACAALKDVGVRSYFLPKSNAFFRGKGVASWFKMLILFVREPQRWLGSYHKRSIFETVNSMFKRREPTKIRKKLSQEKAYRKLSNSWSATLGRFVTSNTSTHNYSTYK